MPKARPLPRRERERLRHRSEILEAAPRLFVRKGYHEVSMREIAAEAEFATGTLYKFFDSKDTLYAELVRTYARKVIEAIVLPLRGVGDEREKLSHYIHTVIRVLTENAEAVQLYFRQTQGVAMSPSDPDGEVSKVREAALGELSQVIAAGVRKGIFRDVPARETAGALAGLLESLIFQTLRGSQALPAEQIANLAEDLFFRGILSGKKPD